MSFALVLAFLFYIGSTFGWVLELFFRRFKPTNKEHKWVNPGFLQGPYLPLYGFGLDVLFMLSLAGMYLPSVSKPVEVLIIFVVSSLLMTILELIAGEIFIVGFKVQLWDYSMLWGNYKGLICPLFTVFWGALGTAYYYLVNPFTIDAIIWLSHNLVFSFVIGMFFGIFIIDCVYTMQLATKIRTLAHESGIIVRYEELKERVRDREAKIRGRRRRFLMSFSTDRKSFHEQFMEYKNNHQNNNKKV